MSRGRDGLGPKCPVTSWHANHLILYCLIMQENVKETALKVFPANTLIFTLPTKFAAKRKKKSKNWCI